MFVFEGKALGINTSKAPDIVVVVKFSYRVFLVGAFVLLFLLPGCFWVSMVMWYSSLWFHRMLCGYSRP